LAFTRYARGLRREAGIDRGDSILKRKIELADWFIDASPVVACISYMIANLAQPLVLSKIRRCAFAKCQKFYALKGGRGPRRKILRHKCRVAHNNSKRLGSDREERNKKAAIKLAKKRRNLTDEEKRKIERIMGLKYFSRVFRPEILAGTVLHGCRRDPRTHGETAAA
jgi:hypothetical protein